MNDQLDGACFVNTRVGRSLQLIVSLLMLVVGLLIGGWGTVTGCVGLCELGLIHVMGGVTVSGQCRFTAMKQRNSWLLDGITIVVWLACTAVAVLALIRVPPIESILTTDTVWVIGLMVIAGVWFAIAQIVDSGKPLSQRNLLLQTVIYELIALTMICSGLMTFEHSRTPLGWVGGQFIRIWAVSLGIDGLVRMTLGFLEGSSPANALSRIDGLRSVLYGFEWPITRTSDTSGFVSNPASLRRNGKQTAVLISVLLLMLSAWLLTGVVIVGAGERAVCYDVGRIESQPLEPGLHFRLPYPFTRVKSIPVHQVRNRTIGFESSLNDVQSQPLLWTVKHGQQETPFLIGDGTELVAINALVTYSWSKDSNLIVANVKSVIDPETMLKSIAERVLTVNTRSLTLDELLERDLGAWSQKLAEQLQAELRTSIPGLEISAFQILCVHPPVEVAASFLDQVSARIDVEKSRSEASGAAAAELLRCEMMARSSVADSKGSSAKRLTYVKDETTQMSVLSAIDTVHSEVLRRRSYCDAFVEALEHKSVTLIDSRIPPGLRLSLGDASRSVRDARSVGP